MLLATTGVRRGEVRELGWRDLDPDGAELRSVQTLTTVHRQTGFTAPTTKRSRRLIYLDEETVPRIRLHDHADRSDVGVEGRNPPKGRVGTPRATQPSESRSTPTRM